MTDSQRARRCVYLAWSCNVCGCAIVVNSKKAKEEGDAGNMAGLRCHARQFKRNRVTTTTSRNGCQNGTPRRQLHYPTRQPSGGHPPRTRQGILRLLEPPNSHSTWQRNPFQRLHVKIV
eukprot:COSAG06_NODE_21750_length_746_cov_3.060278_1_plen_118_part_10